MDARAGTPAQPSDLIDVDQVVGAYYDLAPDPDDPAQQVVFGTSGHRGSSLDHAFNEAHIVAITAAIVEYRRDQGTDGPLFIGRDTHALSEPAWRTALEVLAAAEVDVMVDARDSWTPTPAVSQSILLHNQTRFAEGTPGLAAPGSGLADGIVVTPSHNPPRDGGFKYNPPHGGPAGSDATGWIADRANEILRTGVGQVKRVPLETALAADSTHRHDYLSTYVDDLSNVLDLEAIRTSGVRIGADPLGGASVEYWAAIAERYDLDLTVVNPQVDPRWSFMTLDWDGKIRMDCSSSYAMASLVEKMAADAPFDIATGNDADSDRHGIVTADGLMNPNHFLAVAIEYLFGGARPSWPAGAAVGKTLVSSALIDRVAAGLDRRLVEVPVGFKWFVPGLLSGEVGFGGEESAGASFLRKDGRVWSTDKDGILLALLASEILATTGRSPSEHHAAQVERHGQSWYARVDAAATREQKARLGALAPSDVTSTTLAGQDITATLTEAPGNGAKIGGLKVTTADAWFAARPSGTEDVYKIYAESFVSAEHLAEVQDAAKTLVGEVLG
ncbi:phosphoglucomutase (alpha-D-glucose-1,6-bisphosphate-dependent) [Promicromonospora citrea]|uniref:Phosphoglucomutase, alpha-D-glucose phosphate-specific n=1 Tax=Promicromonospora citrea TaxID=43677 RepID=A0A8H9L7Q7_9MICO|nr:phosphoglucomutase (alpha-D-glucose-1,6-bisphosphate-dependent) [Promicromonospora citrea]NNH50816.1 alpha-D-glucose phosphate-specific phosphoglucomutase [Promicromonospora citrea]GGM35758.1 phosphoglucomutase, alpha-D-glucose phosphate-specific [Promicromonospora citrea]